MPIHNHTGAHGTRPGTPAVTAHAPAHGIATVLSSVVASYQVETVAFGSDDLEPVIAEMSRLADRGDGLGWVNVGPGLRDDQIDRLPAPTVLGRWFSGRGPAVPMATWTPPRSVRTPTAPVVGIEHSAGPKALDKLREAGTPLPKGWRKVQDHAKHGIVVEYPAGTSHADVLRWMLAACWALCRIDTDDHWIAEIHRPSTSRT